MESHQLRRDHIVPGPARSQDSDTDPLLVTGLPEPEATYLNQIVNILHYNLGQQLVGIYLFGSAAYAEYEPGISDLDVQAVVAERLDQQTCGQIADNLTSQALPCPARRLEFVIYAQHAIKPASRHPQFELNFNTGGHVPDLLSVDPAHEASHWFLLDIAMGRSLGQPLFGSNAADVFGAIPRLWQLEAIVDSLNWHTTHDMTSANNVLNACRGWRFAITNELGSKHAGALWAQQQPECPAIVEQALQRRKGGPPLVIAPVMELIEVIMDVVQTTIRKERKVS